MACKNCILTDNMEPEPFYPCRQMPPQKVYLIDSSEVNFIHYDSDGAVVGLELDHNSIILLEDVEVEVLIDISRREHQITLSLPSNTDALKWENLSKSLRECTNPLYMITKNRLGKYYMYHRVECQGDMLNFRISLVTFQWSQPVSPYVIESFNI